MSLQLPSFSDIPMPVKVGVALVTVTGAFAAATTFLPGAAMWILLAGAMAVGLILLGYALLLKWLRKRSSLPLEAGILRHGGRSPTGISDPASRARLDDLRKNFEGGFQKLKTARKDWYTLPWYVIVGESGSGKTEALRHCNVGFPPGLNNEFQGSGGTINMDWWFTNEAIILDTAGRILFDEVDAAGSNEWKEFLRLLRTSRPNCPINGMLLVIPSDSLIKDTADVLERKAGKISRQLDLIQRELDVRFPVFVIVTKSDKINGFREFFDGIRDPLIQHQILGWSNPLPLDEPFNPEMLDVHLKTVTERLNRRRLALMMDPPIIEENSARRIDQVDSLYAFPKSFAGLMPNLKRYLEMIFVGSEWSNKPLFLRGIYFTSAMREGSALDAELARALGISVDSLPSKIWERERAYFLRDMLTKKAFAEKNLVTRSRHASRQHHFRKAVVMATALLSVILLFGLTWFGYERLVNDIKQQADYWKVAPTGYWEPPYWEPIVYPLNSPAYRGEFKVDTIPRVPAPTLSEYHSDIWSLSQKDIQIPAIFRLWSFSGDISIQRRREAHRRLFELGVIRPVVDSVRVKTRMFASQFPSSSPASMQATSATSSQPAGPVWQKEDSDALAALIRIEAAGDATSYVAGKPAAPNLNSLFRCILGSPVKYEVARPFVEKQQLVLDQLWANDDARAGLSRSLLVRSPDLSAKEYWQDIDTGVNEFFAAQDRNHGLHIQNANSSLSELEKLLGVLLNAMATFKQTEARLLALPHNPDLRNSNYAATSDNWSRNLDLLKSQKADIDEALRKAISFTDGENLSRKIGEIAQNAEKKDLEELRGAFDPLIKATCHDDKSASATTIPAMETTSIRRHLGGIYIALQREEERQKQNIKKQSERVQELVRSAEELIRPAGKDATYATVLKAYEETDRKLKAYDARATTSFNGLCDELAKIDKSRDASIEKTKELFKELPEGDIKVKRQEVCDFILLVSASHQKFLLASPWLDKDISSLLMDIAKESKVKLEPLSKPNIPMTELTGGFFDSTDMPGSNSTTKPDGGKLFEYHPELMKGLCRTHKELEKGFQFDAATTQSASTQPSAATMPALEQQEQRLKWNKFNNSVDEYRKRYVEFWSRDVFDKLKISKPKGLDLAKFSQLFPPNAAVVNMGLGDLGKLAEQALEEAGKADLSPPPKDADHNQPADIKLSMALLAPGGSFADYCNKCTAAWTKLLGNPQAALGVFKSENKYDDYFNSAILGKGYVGRYWRGLTVETGLALLKDENNKLLSVALPDLKRIVDFPLVKPGAGKQGGMTSESINKAKGLLEKICGSEGDAPSLGDPGIDLAIKEIRNPVQGAENRTWVKQVQRLATTLPAMDSADVKISLSKKDANNITDKFPAGYVIIEQVIERDRVPTSIPSSKVAYTESKEFVRANNVGWLDGNGINICFYAHSGAKEPDRLAFSGPWALLRLLHDGSSADKKYTWKAQRLKGDVKWEVTITFMDENKNLVLELDFGKDKIPEVKDWP